MCRCQEVEFGVLKHSLSDNVNFFPFLSKLILNTLRVVVPADKNRQQQICRLSAASADDLQHVEAQNRIDKPHSLYRDFGITLLDQSLLVSFDINRIVRFYR